MTIIVYAWAPVGDAEAGGEHHAPQTIVPSTGICGICLLTRIRQVHAAPKGPRAVVIFQTEFATRGGRKTIIRPSTVDHPNADSSQRQ